MILNVNSLEFHYRSTKVLADVSFAVRPGEMLAILGPNGVGKTTLLKCLNAIHAPSAGVVEVTGRDISNLSPLSVARRIGYVAQHLETGRLTAFDAILLGRRPHIRWQVSEHDLEIVESAIRRLGMEHLMLRYIDTMSGGELQKVCIARALVQEPQVLLLDEPTSSLDMYNQLEILTFIRDVVTAHEMGAVLTLHDLNQALRFADRFLFLKGGVIHAIADQETVSSDIISEVYGLAVHIEYIHGAPVVIPVCDESVHASFAHQHYSHNEVQL